MIVAQVIIVGGVAAEVFDFVGVSPIECLTKWLIKCFTQVVSRLVPPSASRTKNHMFHRMSCRQDTYLFSEVMSASPDAKRALPAGGTLLVCWIIFYSLAALVSAISFGIKVPQPTDCFRLPCINGAQR